MSQALLFLVGLVAAISAKPFFGGPCQFGPPPPPPPCGLPPFIDDLPEDAQQKIRDIWKDYKEGEKCYNEHGLTREVMDSLPREAKKAMHKNGPPLPPPLRKAPKEVQDQFRAIFKEKNISFEEKIKKVYNLAQTALQGDLLKEFNDFHNKMEEHKKAIDEKVEKLSPEAKAAHDKLKELEKQKREIFQNLSDAARDELFELWEEKHKRPKP
ncbi:unnamed protein product [Cylicocyclus nassatus]|uniref:Uncharacterized protein n=1 Tax=Cylicocyclus nassatus TaxID=53992 RepID=A0AA36MAS3_CYLNA|nr:unnamed protein product [Cylicocyclus nassatus]